MVMKYGILGEFIKASSATRKVIILVNQNTFFFLILITSFLLYTIAYHLF